MNPIEAWKLLRAYDKIKADATEERHMNDGTVTPGWKTSEFWLHLLANAPAVAAIFLPASSTALIAITALSHLAAAFYSAQRSGLKAAAMARTVAPAALDIVKAAADALAQAAAKAPAAGAAAAPAQPGA